MKRSRYLIGNWKMNKTSQQTALFIEQLAERGEKKEAFIGIAPPFTSLHIPFSVDVHKGAQNIGLSSSGAHTGEVSPEMIGEHGASFVILGHSERRTVYHETDSMVHTKVELALQYGLLPVVCVGETESEREKGDTMEVIKHQLAAALSGIDLRSVVIAYEPLWAIGTGNVASTKDIEKVHRGIRNYLNEHYGDDAGEEVSILYGGSVKPSNIEELVSVSEIDGFLVGGASLKIEDFVSLTLHM